MTGKVSEAVAVSRKLVIIKNISSRLRSLTTEIDEGEWYP